MNPIVEKLEAHIAENPPNYGDGDAQSILEMLYVYYNQCNCLDTYAIKTEFEELYKRMNGMPLRETDRVIYSVCALCREHEKAGFIEGIKVGIRMEHELNE